MHDNLQRYLRSKVNPCCMHSFLWTICSAFSNKEALDFMQRSELDITSSRSELNRAVVKVWTKPVFSVNVLPRKTYYVWNEPKWRVMMVVYRPGTAQGDVFRAFQCVPNQIRRFNTSAFAFSDLESWSSIEKFGVWRAANHTATQQRKRFIPSRHVRQLWRIKPPVDRFGLGHVVRKRRLSFQSFVRDKLDVIIWRALLIWFELSCWLPFVPRQIYVDWRIVQEKKNICAMKCFKLGASLSLHNRFIARFNSRETWTIQLMATLCNK